MQKTIAYEPTRVQLLLKAKRCNECFADATFEAENCKNIKSPNCLSTELTITPNNNSQQSVSAAFTVGQARKLFIYKERGANTTATISAKLNIESSDVTPLPVSSTDQDCSAMRETTVQSANCGKMVIGSTSGKILDDLPVGDKSKDPDPGGLEANPNAATATNTGGVLKMHCSRLDGASTVASRRSADVDEIRRSKRLSRGWLDFAHSSTDRLQRWKSKLQNGKRHKDSSEPPPTSRKMLIDNDSIEPTAAEAEVVLDWCGPNLSGHKNMRKSGDPGASISTSRINRPRVIQPNRSTGDLLQIAPKGYCDPSSVADAVMEHRTLKRFDERPILGTQHHVQCINFQRGDLLVGTNGNTVSNLPPPARITPFSGVKPKDSDIIRPIAFRPYIANGFDGNKQSAAPSLTDKIDAIDVPMRSPINDEIRAIKAKSGMFAVSMNGRSQGVVHQPSTSGSLLSKICKKYDVENLENDYDVVPECLERASMTSDSQSIVTTSPSHRNLATSSGQRSSSSYQLANGCRSSATFNSPQNSVKKSCSSSYQILSSNNSSGSRHSSGIHVTPSPSDSGIVDYEMIIRDKENELNNVRSAMEQNEEVVIKVYTEKERLWKEQILELKQKLQMSQQGETALRQEIQRCSEQKEQFQSLIQNLNSDKQGLQRKCLQLERELFQVRERNDELSRVTCESCLRGIAEKRVRPPVPTPRFSKDGSQSERELRSEINELRAEVQTLRETLNEQIGLFSNERRRWEEEQTKIPSTNANQNVLPTENASSPGQRQQHCMISSDRLI